MPHICCSCSTCDSPKRGTLAWRASSARSSAAASSGRACLEAKASASASREGSERRAMFSRTAT
eukprot:5056962-Prymnesium_polylepis.1